MKIDSSSDFDAPKVARRTSAVNATTASTGSGEGPTIALEEVGLRFCVYSDKALSLKKAVLNWILARWRALIAWSKANTGPASGTGANLSNPAAGGEQRHGSHFWALRSIALSIRAGERVGIVGHNGAGKTTLLKLIARIYTPTCGRIRVRGRVAPLMELGAAFNGELSARDNILLHGALLGFDRRTMLQRMQTILDFADVAEFSDLQVKYFSAGMSARLAFSIATDVDPEILLVDEIFATGDANFRQKATARMRALMGRSAIVVMTSHDLDLVAELCNRVLLMHHGRIVADGTPQVVLARYEQQIRQSQKELHAAAPDARASAIQPAHAHAPSGAPHTHAPTGANHTAAG